MLHALLVLLGFQFAGELVARVAGLPVPGPVIGLVLLFIGLVHQHAIPGTLQSTAATFLQHLGLLFVPAGVGVLAFADRLTIEGPRLALVLVVTTAVTILVTAAVMMRALRILDSRESTLRANAPGAADD